MGLHVQARQLQAPSLFPQIIAHAVWLYFRFPLSLRLVEEMLFGRGMIVSYETIHRWAGNSGPDLAGHLRRKQPRSTDIWHLELSVHNFLRRGYGIVAQDNRGQTPCV